MNRYAYKTTGLAIKALAKLAHANIQIHNEKNIPKGSVIFAVNHFTRIETILLPYHIYQLIRIPVWSLADYGLFVGFLKTFLDKMGAVSTRDPDRDRLIVKSLLTGEAAWIIFPEGCMVKNKKIMKNGNFMVFCDGCLRPPHTGLATLALRAEFYRQRLLFMQTHAPDEASRLANLFQIKSPLQVNRQGIFIVPVNITYYPMRARENILSTLASLTSDDVTERMIEEIMTEGTMLLSGVDMDIRFSEPIKISQYMKNAAVKKDITSAQAINFDDPIHSKKILRRSVQRVTDRYMSSIYSMTTVNHDHLCASLLKHLPRSYIDTDDFKRRLYLAATSDLHKLSAFRHKSLDCNQISLLTDDRYLKYANFLKLAIQTGVIEKSDDGLIRKSAFSATPEFHLARIENPVAVIANEAEPLHALQNELETLARQPAIRTKYHLTRKLIQKAQFDFERDYANFAIEGESKPKAVGRPYFVKGTSRDIGVVLIHGYMAAPLEVKELADYLGSQGIYVYAPRLTGHGTAPEDLALRSYMDWVDAVDEGYVIIRNICKRVIAGGFSAGAGLALFIASRINAVDGVFAVCPPLKLKNISARFVPAVNAWNRLLNRVNIDSGKMEFVENCPENPHINYVRNPIAGVRELESLMDDVEARLPAITAPALVIQAYGDPVVEPDGALKTYEQLGSADKLYQVFNFDRHGIVSGLGAQRVHRAIGDFVEHCGKLT